jgi:HlyD family secretion protein
VWKWVSAATIATVVTFAVAFAQSKKRAEKPSVAYETAPVARGRIQARVTASGTLSPIITVQVGSQVSGRIQSLGADFNSVVKKGQVIARIDPELFRAAVEQAKANLLVAQSNVTKSEAQVDDARRQADRSRELFSKHLIAQADFDTAETNRRVAEATLDSARSSSVQAEAALHQSKINLDYTTITSPIDGTVISRNVDVGQTVAASLASPTLFLIAQDLKRMQVDTNIAEADVGRLKAGIGALFTVDAYPGDVFHGTIREVRNAPQTIQNVVTYDAVIDVDNSDLRLKPGMTANVTVVFADRADVLRVANAALRFRPPPELTGPGEPFAVAKTTEGSVPVEVSNDRRTVWVLENGMPRAVEVRIGVSDGTFTELVQSTLPEGAALVTEAIGHGKGGAGSFGRVF